MRKIYIPPYLNPKRNYFARFICAPGCIFLSLYFIVGGLYELYGYEVRRVEQCAVVVHPPQPKHKLSVNFHCSDDKSKFMYTFYPVDGGEVLAALNEKRVDFEFHAIPYFKNDQNVALMYYEGNSWEGRVPTKGYLYLIEYTLMVLCAALLSLSVYVLFFPYFNKPQVYDQGYYYKK